MSRRALTQFTGKQVGTMLMLLMLVASGCAHGPNYFEPSERVQGVDAEGNRVALYPLRGPKGIFGEAKLSSRGARMTERDGEVRSFIQLAIELHNTSDETLSMRRDATRLHEVQLTGGRVRNLTPLRGGDLEVAPQESARWQLFYELPAGVRPLEVGQFLLEWEVKSSTQRYKQQTLFIERARQPSFPRGYIVYDIHHPDYWHYRRLGYCADPLCETVIRRPPPPRRGPRTRAKGR